MPRLQKDSTIPSVASTSQEGQENRTLKVTLLSNEWKSSTDGELSTINRELAIQLAKHPNVDVSVLLPSCSREDRSSAKSHNVKLIEAQGVPGVEPVLCLSSPPTNHAMHCVIGHGVHLGRVITIIKRNPNYCHCKWIQVVHSAPEEDGMYRNISEGQKKQETEIQLCQMADQVVTIGPKLAEAYKRYLRPSKQGENVFDLTPSIFSEFLEKEQATEERQTFCVLVIGSGDSCEDFTVKGYDIAAEAIAELKDESYKLMFVCAPGGKGYDIAEKLLQHGISRNQLLVRNFSDSREVLANLFCEVDLAIMPSRTDGFGIKALEAMSAGLPILVSSNSGLGQALKKVVLGSQCVVDSEDPKDWAKEIKRVRQKVREVRLSESRSLRKKYMKKYSWEETCRRLVNRMYELTFGSSTYGLPPPVAVDYSQGNHPAAFLNPNNQGSQTFPQSQNRKPSSENDQDPYAGASSTHNSGPFYQGYHPQEIKRRHEEIFRKREVPLEIHARGPVAVKAYNYALKDGVASVNRIPVILVGQGRTGKTSLKRSLKGEPFDRFEESTDGIQADPAYFKVSKEIWKTGQKIKDAGPESSLSFENLAAAKLILERLRKETSSSQDLPEEQSGTATHFAAKETDTDVALSSPSRSNGSENSRRYMLEIPEEVVDQVKQLLQREKDVCDNDDIYSILWDFAGRSVYYDTHPIFLIENAIYLLVANLSHNPEEKATPSVKKGLYRNTVDSHSDRTNLDFLDFWMSSIFSLVSSEFSSSETGTASHENLPGRLPPVFLVCTHADKPFLNTNARDQALEVFGFLRSKAYREHLFKDVFVVDNTKSGGDHECPEVVRLREKVLAVAKELPLMKNKIPLRWLKYESLLHIRMKRDKWIPLDEARRIAFGECTVHDEVEFLTLLNFLHDQRLVVHFRGSPELDRMVILDPQWLVDVLKKIITVKRYQHSEKQVEALWLKLEETGILDERLIDHAWRHLFDNQESRNSLIAIIERLRLLYSWPSADCNRQYLVPSMLMSPPTEDVLRLLDSVKIPSLFITFASGRVPPGLFSRLILLFLPWCSEEWNSKMTPQLFHNFAIFHILPGQGVSLIFRCHSSSIEIVVYSGDIDNETGAKTTRGNIDQTLSRAIHWKLRLVLECMRKEFHWLKNVKYDMCVCCPVCSQPGSVKCHPHDVHGCECLHFLSESDLRQRQYCDRPGHNPIGDCRIRVKQFECWFSFEYVEESAGIFPNWLQDFHAPRHGSYLDEKGIVPSEGAKRKELALPKSVKKSIQSIPLHSARDVKDIVIQFQEALQLEPASLTSPEPETKNMIRGLVLRAKSEKRDDLVKHLRKITPAGTAGPLLNEDMSVGCMPFEQYKDLTFSLSGGNEWKLLAERLGFSQIEIRFLDKRVVNPSDVVLGAVGKQRHLSVGELYDTLVDCELPVTADLM